jgi:hypothetical protein
MICKKCAHAADHRLGHVAHCTSVPGPESQCDCQHRSPRYAPTPTDDIPAHFAIPVQTISAPA